MDSPATFEWTPMALIGFGGLVKKTKIIADDDNLHSKSQSLSPDGADSFKITGSPISESSEFLVTT